MNKTVAQYLAEQSTRNKAKASHWNELTSDKHFKNKLKGKSTNTVSERIATKKNAHEPDFNPSRQWNDSSAASAFF